MADIKATTELIGDMLRSRKQRKGKTACVNLFSRTSYLEPSV
jgi:hypothetical protein